MKAKIHVTLKNGVLDPQGRAIAGALKHMGFSGIDDVKQGKYIEIDLQATTKEAAEETVKKMCETLLANTVIENYSVEIFS